MTSVPRLTKKRFFKALPKYQALLVGGQKDAYELEVAEKKALMLSAIEFAYKNQKVYSFNYDTVPPLWLSQDKFFCELFCKVTNRDAHARAIAIMPYDQNHIQNCIESDHNYCQHIPYDLYFDADWIAHIAVHIEPRVLSNIPSKAHTRPELRDAIMKLLDSTQWIDELADVRKQSVLWLMPYSCMSRVNTIAETEAGRKFQAMLNAPSFRDRIVKHPQGLSEVI